MQTWNNYCFDCGGDAFELKVLSEMKRGVGGGMSGRSMEKTHDGRLNRSPPKNLHIQGLSPMSPGSGIHLNIERKVTCFPQGKSC